MARKRVSSSKKEIKNLRKKYKATVYQHKKFEEKDYLGAPAIDPYTVTPEMIKQREEDVIDNITYSKKGQRKAWETGKNRPLPETKRLSTDDIRNLLIGIPMAVVAGGIAYKSAQKIGYALKHRGMKRNVTDLSDDAKRQLGRSMKAIQRAMLTRQKFLWGRRGRSYHGSEDED